MWRPADDLEWNDDDNEEDSSWFSAPQHEQHRDNDDGFCRPPVVTDPKEQDSNATTKVMDDNDQVDGDVEMPSSRAPVVVVLDHDDEHAVTQRDKNTTENDDDNDDEDETSWGGYLSALESLSTARLDAVYLLSEESNVGTLTTLAPLEPQGAENGRVLSSPQQPHHLPSPSKRQKRSGGDEYPWLHGGDGTSNNSCGGGTTTRATRRRRQDERRRALRGSSRRCCRGGPYQQQRLVRPEDYSPPYDAFICHAGEQKSLAVSLYLLLSSHHNLLAFLDRLALVPWRTEHRQTETAIHAAVQQASLGIFILTPEFIVKKWPMKELKWFLERLREEENEKKKDDGQEVSSLSIRRQDVSSSSTSSGSGKQASSERKKNKLELVPIFYGMTPRQCNLHADKLYHEFRDYFDSPLFRERIDHENMSWREALDEIAGLLNQVATLTGIVETDDINVLKEMSGFVEITCGRTDGTTLISPGFDLGRRGGVQPPPQSERNTEEGVVWVGGFLGSDANDSDSSTLVSRPPAVVDALVDNLDRASPRQWRVSTVLYVVALLALIAWSLVISIHVLLLSHRLQERDLLCTSNIFNNTG